MRVIADLQLHSKFALATSRDMDLEHIAEGARTKGLGLLGTGDFTHPTWLGDLKSKLEPIPGAGLFSFGGVSWMLAGEVSTVYSQEGRTRKVHHLIYSPSFEIVGQINEILSAYGNLASDGRPVLNGIDSAELVERVTAVSKEVVVIPAHAWTPWFGVFGSKSGFDSLKECYQDQSGKIFAIETGLSCYDSMTEVLTESGWKKFPHITQDDKICTLNVPLDRIEFQKPDHLVTSDYRGKMYLLRTRRVDLCVTPNHRLFVTQFGSRGPKPFRLQEARVLFGRSKTFRKDGIWEGKSVDYFELPAVRARHGSRFYSGLREIPLKKLPAKQWMEFFGLWIAEGHTNKGTNGDYNVILSNSDRRLVTRMVQVFRELGYRPLTIENQPGCFQIRVRNYQLYAYLKRFGQSHQKFIPVEVKQLSKELLAILLDSYLKGDGHVYGRTGKGLSATTNSVRLRDDLQEMALKVGMSAYYKLGTKRGTPLKALHSGRYKARFDAWVVYFLRHNRHGVTPSVIRKQGYTESWADFDGKVYCVSVPNHVIYVRRNGIPVWCGNSDPLMNWRLSQLDGIALVSNSDAHSPNPWRLGREANVFELQKLGYKEVFDAIRQRDSRRFLYTIEVDPAYGKYHYSGHRKCGVSLSPQDSRRVDGRCPSCGKKVTVGVMERLEQLADRPDGYRPEGAIPYKDLLPLYEVISFATGVNRLYVKQVIDEQDRLIRTFGTEFGVLLDADDEELRKSTKKAIADAILSLRGGRATFTPGYDGVYGTPRFSEA